METPSIFNLKNKCLFGVFCFAVYGITLTAQPTENPMKATINSLLTELTSEAMNGRMFGSEGGSKARSYLIGQLQSRGFKPLGEEPGSFEQPVPGGGVNLIGVIYPENHEGGQPKVLLSAHYDGLGNLCEARANAATDTCNGAMDNGAGVAAVIAAAESLRNRIQSPLAVVLFDGEEQGLRGSMHFLKKPTIQLSSLNLLINLDIIGLNLFKGLEHFHFAIGAESGGNALISDLRSIFPADLEVQQLSYAFGHYRSDMTAFVEGGAQLPFVFFSDGDGGYYHSSADELSQVNIPKVVRVAEMVAELALLAGKKKTPYPYSLGRPGANHLPQFGDIHVLKHLLETIKAHRQENRLDDLALERLEQQLARLEALKQGGEQAFSNTFAVHLMEAAGGILHYSREMVRMLDP